jgi:hypothetical protein
MRCYLVQFRDSNERAAELDWWPSQAFSKDLKAEFDNRTTELVDFRKSLEVECGIKKENWIER